MRIKITSNASGLEKFNQKLEDLANAAKKIDETNRVTLYELFPDSFMQRYTNFGFFDEILEQARQEGYKVDSVEEFKAIPDKAWDDFISSHSQFTTWHEMQQKGATEWAKHQLGL